MNMKLLSLFSIVIVLAAYGAMAQPTGPFTNDADTFMLMHLDGPAATLDNGPNVLAATFSQVGGTPDPACHGFDANAPPLRHQGKKAP